ncbi:MAG TPA: hypothetical protein VHL09_07995, partial [Dehalococcoidia bacterium]|nr:hypothetical protein [Dehalococcoidia bacterium]
EVESLTPLPPYFSLAERIITQLREIGIRTRVNNMERAAFIAKLTEGPGAFNGMILNISGAPGDAANRIRAFAICPPQGTSSRTCDPQIDEKFAQFEASANPQERDRLLTEIQNYILDNHIFVPLYRLANVSGQGPRIANNLDELFGAIPQWPYMGPYEDIRLNE